MEEEGVDVSVGGCLMGSSVRRRMCGLFVDGETLPHGLIDNGVIVELDFDETGTMQVPLVVYFDGYEVGGYVVREPCQTTNRRG